MSASARPRLSGASLRAAALSIPAALVLALALVLAVSHGGFAATVWYPAALVVLAAVVLVLLLSPPLPVERSRVVELTLAAYAAFCAINYASILWADVPGQAWDAANRATLYGLVLGLSAMRPWPARLVRHALLATVLAIAGVAIGTLAASAHGDPGRLFLEGRLASPLGYSNATGDFWLIGVFPALGLACTPRLVWPLRGLALAVAGLLAEISLLSQSRGAALALALVAVAFIAFFPRRWPALIAIAACGGAVALTWSTLIAVRDVRSVAALGPALTDARRSIVVSVLVLLVVGTLAALLDRRFWSGRPAALALGRLGDWALVVLAALGVVVALAIIGNPVSWTKARFDDFKTSGYTQVEAGRTRFTGSLGSNRYDFYRVAWHQFTEHPLAGNGADNFAAPYLRLRRSPETPTYAHSFGFETLAGLGLVGALAALTFLALALVAIGRALRANRAAAGLVVSGAAAFAVFYIHGLADWLWQFPALGVLAFALLGLSMRTAPETTADLRPAVAHPGQQLVDPAASRTRLAPVLRRAGAALLTLAIATSLALPAVAARLTDAAYQVSASDPTLAVNRLARAGDLNFLRADGQLAQGLIQQALGQSNLAAGSFRRALAREPVNWFAALELAIADESQGARAEARQSIARAALLNPQQPVIGQVRALVDAGRPVDPQVISNQLNAQLAAKLKPTG